MFIVTFQTGTDLREVYKITNVCHCIVQWDKYKNPRPIQQCFKCQQFGHSSAYCGRPTRCVKCDKSHSTQDCQKPATAPPKCVNCGGEHPANHTGCPVYIKQLESRNRRLPRPSTRSNHQPLTQSQFPPLRQPTEAKRQAPTWAQVTSKQSSPQDTQTLPSIIDSLKSILSTLNLQRVCVALRTLANQLQAAQNPMDKTLIIVDTIMGFFTQSP